MNYFYDVILNWSDNSPYSFYEWNDTDYLELIKKIPIFKVKHKVFMDIINNNIKVDIEFLEMIKDRTLVSSKKEVIKIVYACIITDGKNTIALEFNEKGLSVSRSNLLIDDELNALEIAHSLKEFSLNYEILGTLEIAKDIRQVSEIKKVVSLEINNLYKKKDIAKLKYLYYEYKREHTNDLELIYNRMINEINSSFSNDILKIYYIIKLSYHNV